MWAVGAGRGWRGEQLGFRPEAWGPAQLCPAVGKSGTRSELLPTAGFWKRLSRLVPRGGGNFVLINMPFDSVH